MHPLTRKSFLTLALGLVCGLAAATPAAATFFYEGIGLTRVSPEKRRGGRLHGRRRRPARAARRHRFRKRAPACGCVVRKG